MFGTIWADFMLSIFGVAIKGSGGTAAHINRWRWLLSFIISEKIKNDKDHICKS
jgi:hypothetical protein